MQRMETNTASARVVNGWREHVIDIHEHGGDHDQIARFPGLPIEHTDNNCRNQKVKYQMNHDTAA